MWGRRRIVEARANPEENESGNAAALFKSRAGNFLCVKQDSIPQIRPIQLAA
jgi:hypothetical protein